MGWARTLPIGVPLKTIQATERGRFRSLVSAVSIIVTAGEARPRRLAVARFGFGDAQRSNKAQFQSVRVRDSRTWSKLTWPGNVEDTQASNMCVGDRLRSRRPRDSREFLFGGKS